MPVHSKIRAEPASAAVNTTSASTLTPDVTPRQNRKLPERILVAAHEACDLGNLEVAAKLLSTLEVHIGHEASRVDLARRRTMRSMIAAHHRLWQLRHADYATVEPLKEALGFHESGAQNVRSQDWLLGGCTACG